MRLTPFLFAMGIRTLLAPGAAASELPSILGMPSFNVQTAIASSKAPLSSASLLALASKPLASAFASVRKPCPRSCEDAGLNPANWTRYHDLARLAQCDEAMLLDFAVYTPLDGPKYHKVIQACSANYNTDNLGIPAPPDPAQSSCTPAKNTVQVNASLQMAWIDASDHDGTAADVETAAQQLQNYLATDPGGCETTTVFASFGPAVVGIYSGSEFHAQEIEIYVLQQFVEQVRKGISETLLVQYCATDHEEQISRWGLLQIPIPTSPMYKMW
jgi:hypothetical protein